MKLYILLFAFNLVHLGLFSQDLIFLKDGSSVNVKVIEIGIDDIKYRKQSPDGPLYVIKKSDVNKIRFPGGQEEIISQDYQTEQTSQLKKLVKMHEDAVTGKQGKDALKTIIYKGNGWKAFKIAGFGTRSEQFSDSNYYSVVSKNGIWTYSYSKLAGARITNGSGTVSIYSMTSIWDDLPGCDLLAAELSNIEYKGLVNNDKPLHLFEIKRVNNLISTVLLDPDSMLPVGGSSYAKGAEKYIQNYQISESRRISGFWIPTKTSLVTYEDVQVNKDLTRYFEVPDVEKINKSLDKRKSLTFDQFVNLPQDASWSSVLQFVETNKLSYVVKGYLTKKDSLKVIRIGAGEMNTITLSDVENKSVDFIDFGFEKDQLKYLSMTKWLNTRYSLADDEKSFFANAPTICNAFDTVVSQKIGNKPSPGKWDSYSRGAKEVRKDFKLKNLPWDKAQINMHGSIELEFQILSMVLGNAELSKTAYLTEAIQKRF
jgi:hypothetical protein